MKFSRPRTHKGGPAGVPKGTSRTPTAEDEGLENFILPQQHTVSEQALRISMLAPNYVSYLDIVSKLNIAQGDRIYVSSNILKWICTCRENNETFDANRFIDCLIEKIGPSGTLIFPTFFWGFCRGETPRRQRQLRWSLTRRARQIPGVD